MKALLVAAGAAVLLAGSAFAQGAGNLGQQQPGLAGSVPATQQGSGQRAGGPASELNRGGMAAPMRATTTRKKVRKRSSRR